MIIYLDNDYKCHVENDGTMQEIETEAFEGKCASYIEGYRFVPQGESWEREDGTVFHGEMITPWRDYDALQIEQFEYLESIINQIMEVYNNDTESVT